MGVLKACHAARQGVSYLPLFFLTARAEINFSIYRTNFFTEADCNADKKWP